MSCENFCPGCPNRQEVRQALHITASRVTIADDQMYMDLRSTPDRCGVATTKVGIDEEAILNQRAASCNKYPEIVEAATLIRRIMRSVNNPPETRDCGAFEGFVDDHSPLDMKRFFSGKLACEQSIIR